MSNTQYIESKLDGKKYCKTNGHFTRHLRDNNLTYKDYYEIYISGYTPLCRCLNPLSFYQPSESYANSCGDAKCVGHSVSNTKKSWSSEQRQSDSVNKKIAAANKTADQKAAQLIKTRTTFFEKYGVEWVAKSDTQKEKSRKTKLLKYGDPYYNNSTQSALANRNKTLEETAIICNKRRQTNLERYGVENPLLQPLLSSKTNKGNASVKDYYLPSGKVIGVRGYEPLALDILFKTYTETDLTIHDNYAMYAIEIFEYTSADRRIKRYYPDIYIPAESRIIEVKGQWWWDGNGRSGYANRIINNLKKRQAVLDKGYTYEVWLFASKNNYRILKYESDFQIK